MSTYFITRHKGAKDWGARQKIPVDRFVEHLDIAEIRPGDIVMGSLPVHLAAEVCRRGARYFHLSIELAPECRGRELSAEDLEQYGAILREFVVTVADSRNPE